MTMSTPITLEDLKRFRSIVETGTPLDKRTVLNIISHAGQIQEHFDSALEANQALVEQLARTEQDERIIAWDWLSRHPAFTQCYAAEKPLSVAMSERLGELLAAERTEANDALLKRLARTQDPTIDTLEGLLVLPIGSIVIDAAGDFMQVQAHEFGASWHCFDDHHPYGAHEVELPASVIYVPEATDADL